MSLLPFMLCALLEIRSRVGKGPQWLPRHGGGSARRGFRGPPPKCRRLHITSGQQYTCLSDGRYVHRRRHSKGGMQRGCWLWFISHLYRKFESKLHRKFIRTRQWGEFKRNPIDVILNWVHCIINLSDGLKLSLVVRLINVCATESPSYTEK